MTPKELIESVKGNQKDLSKGGIYAIYNFLSDKIYIGQTKRDIARRFREHKRNLAGGYHNNPILKYSYNYYGLEAFIFIALENCPPEMLNEREIYYGSQISREQLLNCNPLGETVPISEETKAKLRAKRKGRKFSQEVKDKIGNSHRGRIHTEEARNNMKRGHINCKCHTPEANKARWELRRANAKKAK